MTIFEKERITPVSGTYDVIVAGGGIAGIAASLAATRHGAKTLLIEREYALGGLATLGLVTVYLPLCDGEGRQCSFGIAEELLRLSISHGHERLYPDAWLDKNDREARRRQRFEVQFSANVFALLCEQTLVEAGVEILYGTSVCGVRKEDGKITHLLTESKSGRTAFACKSVVDATGDAILCREAEEKTALYRYGNTVAAWYYFLDEGQNRLQLLGYAEDPNTPQNISDDCEHFSGVDATEVSRMMRQSHADTLRHFLERGDITENYSLTAIAAIPQLRMTRRLCGAYTLDVAEAHKAFSDSCGMISNWRKKGPVYEVPFRCLYGKTRNLAVAGRIVSATDEMWDISRVIPPCAVTGQAAGTAAAMTDDFPALSVSQLQNTLRRDGVLLHEDDLGRK